MEMRLRNAFPTILGATGLLLAAGAVATGFDSLENDGKWTARIEVDGKVVRQAQVVISQFGGEWRDVGTPRAGEPCRSAKRFPITVQSSGKGELEFTVWAAHIQPKCPDVNIKGKVSEDGRTMVGLTEDGRPIRMSRR